MYKKRAARTESVQPNLAEEAGDLHTYKQAINIPGSQLS